MERRNLGTHVGHLRPKSVGIDKVDARWESGVWLGVRDLSGEVDIGPSEGILKVRTVRRKGTTGERWDAVALGIMKRDALGARSGKRRYQNRIPRGRGTTGEGIHRQRKGIEEATHRAARRDTLRNHGWVPRMYCNSKRASGEEPHRRLQEQNGTGITRCQDTN